MKSTCLLLILAIANLTNAASIKHAANQAADEKNLLDTLDGLLTEASNHSFVAHELLKGHSIPPSTNKPTPTTGKPTSTTTHKPPSTTYEPTSPTTHRPIPTTTHRPIPTTTHRPIPTTKRPHEDKIEDPTISIPIAENLNPYRGKLVNETHWLDIMIKKGKLIQLFIDNPYMTKLIKYYIEDLKWMNQFFKIFLEIYKDGTDPSMPHLTNLIDQLIEYAQFDIGVLRTYNHSNEASNLENEVKSLQNELNSLQQKMVAIERNYEQVVRMIDDVINKMIHLQDSILDKEIRTNINHIIH